MRFPLIAGAKENFIRSLHDFRPFFAIFAINYAKWRYYMLK